VIYVLQYFISFEKVLKHVYVTKEKNKQKVL